MPLSLVAAVSKNNCIGINNKLPWHLPEDFKHFKEVTAGKIVLMGRKTWESLPEKSRPLPGRKNIVITRQQNYAVPGGVEVYPDIQTAISAHPNEEIMVIGGAEIYRQTMGIARTLYITHVDKIVEGDAFFPDIDSKVWQEITREDFNGFSFVTYKKVLGQ